MQSYADAARGMLRLSQSRIGDLFALKMPHGLRDATFREVSNLTFRSFDDQQIDLWLRSESDSFRKTIALKVVLCLPTKRIRSILDKYIVNKDRYYYDSVFWLDLGATADKATALKVAKAEIMSP
jgi:hypothetical protein